MAYDPETHTFTTICFEDAFRVALHTLEARRSRFGVSSGAMYPNLKKGLAVGLIAGFMAAALVFGLCFWVSTWPAVTEVSLTWSFRPWWRSSNWLAALAAFIFVTLVFGVLAAFRPDFSSKR